MMDPVASVVDQFKGFTISTREFINGFMQNQDASSCRNPVFSFTLNLCLTIESR